ncbi:OmpP1/FadL family transporter [Calditrichota bacterium]
MQKIIGIVLSVLFLTANICAQFAEDATDLLNSQYGFGARSISMGGAFSGVADDYSAIYWNPAGLAQIKKMEFYGGISHLKYENEATFYGTRMKGDDSFTKLSSIGLVFPVPTYRGSLVFALGYQRIKEFDKTLHFSGFNPNSNDLFFTFIENNDTLDYYFDKNVQQEEFVQQSGHLNNWSFASAVDISQNVSVGATLNFWTGSSTYIFDFIQTDKNNLYPNAQDPLRDTDYDSYSISQKIIGEYSAFQIKIGALMRPSNSLRIGLNISLPSTFNVVEKYNDSDELVFDLGDSDAITGEPSEFEYDVSTPFQFDLGASYKLKDFTISGGLEYVDLSQVEFELPDDVNLDENYSALLDENKRIKDLYQEKMKLKAGIEYFWRDQNLVFRSGYLLDPSPLKDAPSDFDRNFITGGLGLVVDKQFLIDVAYMYGYWKNFSSDTYTPGGTDEDITYQKIFLTTSFRF